MHVNTCVEKEKDIAKTSKDKGREIDRKRDKSLKMGFSSLLRSPNSEGQEVPNPNDVEPKWNITCVKDEEKIFGDDDDGGGGMYSRFDWDFMDWKGFGAEEEEGVQNDTVNKCSEIEKPQSKIITGRESSCGCWDNDEEDTNGDGDEKRVALNLNLNYEEVMDAWSDRRPLWALPQFRSLSLQNNTYKGEVPEMEEEKSRREASVLRYKEKRQSRLFSKKIRYEVRKLNADKRPRLKGRFVKRVPEMRLLK